jgi:hypothetical protein
MPERSTASQTMNDRFEAAVKATRNWKKQDQVLEDLQIIQANFYRDTIKSAVAHLPDPPDVSPFKTARKDIVHLLLRRKMSLPACCERLGFPQTNRSAVAMQLHQFCREVNLKAWNKGIVWHMRNGEDRTGCERRQREYGYRTDTKVSYLQLHAEEFLR